MTKGAASSPCVPLVSCRSLLVFVLDVCLTGGVQCGSAVVDERGAGMGRHR